MKRRRVLYVERLEPRATPSAILSAIETSPPPALIRGYEDPNQAPSPRLIGGVEDPNQAPSPRLIGGVEDPNQ